MAIVFSIAVLSIVISWACKSHYWIVRADVICNVFYHVTFHPLVLSVWHCLCVWPLSLGPLHLFIYALLFHPHVGSSCCVCLHSHFIYFLFFSKPPKPLSHSALSLCLFLILPVSSSPQCSAVLANLDSDFWDACNVSWNPSVFLDLVGSFSLTYSCSFFQD